VDIDYAFICDYAEGGPRGKISALGIGFDSIFAPKVPHRFPHFHLVFQLRASIAEVGRKGVFVSLIDADGKEVVPPLKREIEILKPSPGEIEATVRGNIGFANVEFPRFGNYSIHVVVAGVEMTRIPLRVVEPPAQHR
jgi:hypothetical protein